MNSINQHLFEYNGIVKETDKLYRDVARNLGLSDSAFWILYALREATGTLTQTDIVTASCLPAQTVNSALKKLESEGIVTLRATNDRRKKQLSLTPAGEALAARTVDRVLELENAAVESRSVQEQQRFLGLFRKYTDALSRNFTALQEEV